MSETTSKNCVTRTREYEVREIDESGDAVDTNHYETKSAAEDYAARLMTGGSLAVVVELHTMWFPLGERPDKYTTISTYGDDAALRAGGWID